MTRLLVILIAAYIVYYLVKNSLRGNRNTAQRTPQKREEKEADVINTHLKEIAYVFYSAKKDNNTCDVCKALDGRHLLPNHKMLQNAKPPHPGCKNPDGCRCTLVYVTRDEEGSKEIESLLKRSGGMCERQTIERGLTK